MSVVEELLKSLPEVARKHLDAGGPASARMLAARGLAPLPPRELVIVLCGLSLDSDEKIASSARESLAKLPETLLRPVVESQLPPVALAALAPAPWLSANERLLEAVVVNRNTPDMALAEIAPTASERVVEMLVTNQERCLRSEALVRGIRANPRVIKSTLDRLFDFLVRSGVIYGDMPEFAESLARLTPQEIQEVADNVELPPEAHAYLIESDEGDQSAASAALAQSESESSPEQDAQPTAKGRPERVSMLKLISTLNAAQKVALALKGNKEARTALIRDSNKVVSSAAIRSPRITEQEVISAAQSRSISDDVLRLISNSRDMTRSYGVKAALVNNPKTPLPVAMRFLPLLRSTDLKSLSKSKNVSSAVANQAKRMMQAKSSGAK